MRVLNSGVRRSVEAIGHTQEEEYRNPVVKIAGIFSLQKGNEEGGNAFIAKNAFQQSGRAQKSAYMNTTIISIQTLDIESVVKQDHIRQRSLSHKRKTLVNITVGIVDSHEKAESRLSTGLNTTKEREISSNDPDSE